MTSSGSIPRRSLSSPLPFFLFFFFFFFFIKPPLAMHCSRIAPRLHLTAKISQRHPRGAAFAAGREGGGGGACLFFRVAHTGDAVEKLEGASSRVRLHGAQLWPHGAPRWCCTPRFSLSGGRRLWARAHPMLRACHLFVGGAAAGGKGRIDLPLSLLLPNIQIPRYAETI